MIIVIGLQLLLVIWLIRYLVRGDKGPREPITALAYAGMLGFFAVIIGSVLELFIIPSTALPVPGQPAMHIGVLTIILGCIAIGVIEELSKAVPLKRFIYNKGYFNEVSDGIIYFGITGLIFGALENITYALTYGTEVGLIRVITIPFMHAGFTSIIGYAIAKKKVLGLSQRVVVTGYLTAIGLHAFYDFGLFYNQPWSRYSSIAITFLINFMIFLLYKRARRTDSQSVPVPRPV
ncbi:PrsW family intramembrane metalloprotease [Polaromonas sp.]|nr:PrsW family intramembrane metalloprotease [Candidatus Saccharibacteria bacterium]